MAKQQSKPQRWVAAVAKGQEAAEELEALKDSVNEELADFWQTVVDSVQDHINTLNEKLAPAVMKANEAREELQELVEEYQEWYDNMPEQLQGSPTGEKLSEVVNQFDFSTEFEFEMEPPELEQPEFELDIDELSDMMSDAEGADLPVGFGRD